jgi:hypothetical protein
MVDHADLRRVHAPRALRAAARQPSRRWRVKPARVQGGRRQVDSRPPRSKPRSDHRPEHNGTMGALRRLSKVRGQSRTALRGNRRSVLIALAAYDQASAPRPRLAGYSEDRPRLASRTGSSMSKPSKLSLRVGCMGCQCRWGEGEGQCLRCRRCLYCCGVEAIR